jgi:hypothetical protein
MGAIDLKQRFGEIRLWVECKSIYGFPSAIYPLASCVMLWPMIGWLKLRTVRWLWALTFMLSIYWLICIHLRESATLKEQRCIKNNSFCERNLILHCTENKKNKKF